jgi:hypothetical protein
MTDHLDDLSANLVQAMDSSFSVSATESWGNSKPMSIALASVTARFDSPLVRTDRQSVSKAVLRYRQSGELAEFLEIKYVCIGAWEEFSGWCLLEDTRLLERLLKIVQVGSDRRRLKYFSCLLRSYWSFPHFGERTTPTSRNGWLGLRGWLDDQRRELAKSAICKPLWFQTLSQHSNLLADKPCKPYEKDLLAGGSATLNEAFANLGIPSDSWLREEAVYTQMQAGANLDDAGFRSCIARLLDIASGKTEFRLSKGLSIRCIALLVSRYAACSEKPEHITLRDASIAFIGNPWLHRAAWDSYVLRSDGLPDVDAREMLNAWLKVRLIKDFFDLLSEDRSADGRRLNYWLRFEPMIEDMWFVLGADAISDKRKDYVEFRQRANGRLLDLVGATPTQNNAFLMRIGEFVIVEFGLTGNACFAYRYIGLPADIKRRLNSGTFRAQVDIANLKARGYEVRLLHQSRWEPKFDEAICPLFGFRPPGRGSGPPVRGVSQSKSFAVVNKGVPVYVNPGRTYGGVTLFSRLDFERLMSKHSLEVDDLLKKGGCLWVRTNEADPLICSQLKAWGFTYKPGKGWWKE